MTDFFPFMYEPKQKEFDPLPLYAELIEPPLEDKIPENDPKECYIIYNSIII